jgi:dephospho-CoA kinase
MLVVGLTGGIGSGKSTVASLLADRGAVVIDVDGVGREVIAPGGRAESAVLALFGEGVADPAGHIDRAALAGRVFGRREELARLTAVSHPAINAVLAERLAALPDDAVAVLDMAILVESNLGRLDTLGSAHSYSRVVVVEAPEALRVARAVTRGMNAGDVRSRIAAQATDGQRRAVADAVLLNDGDLTTLTQRVDELWSQILAWRAPSH